MSTRIHACHEDDDVGVVHEIMRSHQIRRVPVLDRGDRIVGVVSLNDLAVRSPGQGGRQAKLDVADTLKAVCSPRPVASA
jgi:CBS-domain-containing membrane protein